MSEIASTIKIMLRSQNRSQKQMAEALGVTEVTVSRWVKKKTEPNLDMAKKIATYLDTTVDSLITGEIKRGE